MSNRFMLAPMTNCQSHADGTLSDDEFRWLAMRAQGGFGLTMTCAAHVQAVGQGFVGQLGCFDDKHVEGLTRLAAGIAEHGSVSIVQLHHAGMRSPADLIGEAPVCPSVNEDTGARALTLPEVEQLRDDFIAAAVRSQRAGFDGVEVHGAHGYVLTQFLSAEINHRDDRYGGSFENRIRLILEIIEGIRAACGADFVLGVRLSPERFGVELMEARELCQRLFSAGIIDFLDLSLWDSFKEPNDEAHAGRSLLSYFTDLDRNGIPLGVAGKIYAAADVQAALEAQVDFVSIGRAAILNHDFPRQVQADPEFRCRDLPVSAETLGEEGLGEAFIQYMRRWKGFVAE
jgi:2,4-dienoyl-CoA reductase-like NADH-dependent reductase (Old Yellow Enzyme family)